MTVVGAPALVVEHYRAMGIKQVQHDTLSYLLLSRASTFSLASTGDLTFPTECLESTQVYLSNSQEVFLGFNFNSCFNNCCRQGTLSFARLLRKSTRRYGVSFEDVRFCPYIYQTIHQIPDFTTFEERLDNSLQRDTVKVEHLRMRLTHEAITSDIIDMELIELKFVFDRSEWPLFIFLHLLNTSHYLQDHHDNRDFTILPDYQPKSSPGLHKQTLLFGKPEGVCGLDLLNAFLAYVLHCRHRGYLPSSKYTSARSSKLVILTTRLKKSC